MTQNPMEIAVVVALVNDFTSIHDLANFRLVSKLWYKESLQKWRSNVYPRIYAGDVENCETGIDMLPPEILNSRPPSILVKDLLQLMKVNNILNLSGLPYRNYRLDHWGRGMLLSPPSRQKVKWSRVLRHFFREFGHLMYHLDLSSVHFNNASELEDVIFRKTPNLRTLILGEYRCSDNRIRTFLQNQSFPLTLEEEQRHLKTLKFAKLADKETEAWWISLLQHFPNLENIIFPKIQKTRATMWTVVWVYFEAFLKAVKFLKDENPQKLQIQSLDLLHLHPFPLESLSLLREINLPLKSLKMDISHMMIGPIRFDDNAIIKEFVALFADTLKSLIIRQEYSYTKHLVAGWPFMKRMESLQDLELVGEISQNLTFLKYTPNLIKLRVVKFDKTVCERKTEKLEPMGQLRIPSLCELHADLRLSAESFQLLKDWMPNLEKLSMPLSSMGLAGVGQFWKDSLHGLKLLRGSGVDDQVIICRDRVLFTDSISASIRNLKYLRTFEMEHPHITHKQLKGVPCNHDFPRISITAIEKGFLQLEHLQMIQLYVESRVGYEWCEKLKEKGIAYDIKLVNANNCRDTAPKQG